MKYPGSGQSRRLCDKIPSSRSPSRNVNRVHSPGTFGLRSNKLWSEKRSARPLSEMKQSALKSVYAALCRFPPTVISSTCLSSK